MIFIVFSYIIDKTTLFLSEEQGGKVMRRILSVLLAVCMLFAVATTSGCTLSTAKAIDEAIGKTEALDDVDATLFMEVSMDMGISITVPVTVNMKVKNIKSSTPTMLANMSIPMMGMELKSDIYLESNMLYISTSGMNYKLKVEESDGEYDYVNDVNSIIKNLPEDLLENIEFEENDDGSKSVTVLVDEARFKELFADLVKSSAEDTAMDDNDDGDSVADNIMEKISVSDATVKITVKNGYVLTYEISYSMTVSTVLGDTSANVKASVTYNNPGDAVEITPPDGYKDFADYSEDGLLDLFD